MLSLHCPLVEMLKRATNNLVSNVEQDVDGNKTESDLLGPSRRTQYIISRRELKAENVKIAEFNIPILCTRII